MLFTPVDWESIFGSRDILSVLDLGAVMHTDSLEKELKSAAYGPLVTQKAVRITGFDPDPVACATLNSVFGEPHRFFPYAIGDGQKHKLHVNAYGQTSSLLESNHEVVDRFQSLGDLMTTKNIEEVQTKRLDDIPEITDVDFLKLDIQGAELMALQGAEKLLEKAVIVQTEVEFVELYKNQPLFADIDSYMRSKGFQFYCFSGFGRGYYKPFKISGTKDFWPTQQLWTDAFYIPDIREISKLSVQKLKALAVIAYECMNGVDLCCALLVEIDKKTGENTVDVFGAQIQEIVAKAKANQPLR